MKSLSFPGIFITIEGIEGVGKSTLLRYIEEYLKAQHQPFVLTREPGGTLIADKIRQILLTSEHNESLTPDAELLLMFAARAQHVQQVIFPALKVGKWVVSDRFVDASYAYQGGGRLIPEATIRFLDQWIVNGVIPNKTFLLDASPEIGLARAKQRGEHDRIEQEKVEFFARVRAEYLKRARLSPERFKIIDATQPIEQVQEEVRLTLNQLSVTL